MSRTNISIKVRTEPALSAALHIVWFKRDLRVRDHWPLLRASRAGPVLALYCFEPSQLAQPDAAPRHRAFIEASLAELAQDLARFNCRLLVWHGEVTQALAALRAVHPVAALWSHEETGNLASYARDRAVADWCRAHDVRWTELPQMGVVRRLHDRDRWNAEWEAFMAADVAPLPDPAPDLPPVLEPLFGPLPQAPAPGLFQRGGRRAGVAVLRDFLDGRAAQYRGGISSPLKAPTACSRLSPYLAWGNISMREVVRATRARAAELNALSAEQRPPRLLASLRAFESRLHWHCHFIQKLESEPSLEVRNMHRGYDGLREADFDPARFDAWSRGETGVPLVDACMAMLRETGWLNFRMRAMLMSFAAYQLWLHWREPGLHLARLFTDYEPGIHWPQVQMQSGVTGINALRVYNPVKQARDHDPHGVFVRRWLPALRQVPDAWLFEPWKMPANVQAACGAHIGRDYPAPVVEPEAGLRAARARIAEWRKRPGLKEEAQRVFLQHGSRKGPTRRKPRRAAAAQADLFETSMESA